MQVRNFRANGWDVHVTDTPQCFSQRLVDEGLMLLDRWAACFPREETWVQRTLNVPSLIVRLDCVEGPNGELVVFEVEERPAGIGITREVNADFVRRLTAIQATWPGFDVVRSKLRTGGDDDMWARVVEDPADDRLVLVRAEPGEEEFHHLAPRSVSTVRQKGNKSYGRDLGLWREVTRPEDLPWDQGFALKPLQGSKVHDVELWDGSRKRKGSSTRTRIERVLGTRGRMFCQPLTSPMETGSEQFPWMIFRVFFGFNASTHRWEFLNGAWNARPNLKIHGASDAVFGPVFVG